MKSIYRKLNTLLLVIFFSTILFSCDEGGDPDPGGTAIEELAGDWVVNMTWDGDDVGHATISTYNTSNNDTDKMWVDDHGNGWGLKAKADLNLSSRTFGGNDLTELYYDVTVTITDGIIIPDAATAPSGTVTDSIYFKAEFSDIPGEIWEYAGYRRTGFLEDE